MVNKRGQILWVDIISKHGLWRGRKMKCSKFYIRDKKTGGKGKRNNKITWLAKPCSGPAKPFRAAANAR
jgi:hypothetical protein